MSQFWTSIYFAQHATQNTTMQWQCQGFLSRARHYSPGYVCTFTVSWDSSRVTMLPLRHIISCVPQHHRLFHQFISRHHCRDRTTTGWSILGVYLVISWMSWEPRWCLSFLATASGCPFYPSLPDIFLLSCEPVRCPQFSEAALMLS